MVNRVRMFAAIGMIFLFVASSVDAEEGAASKDAGSLIKKQVLVLGKVSSNPKKHYKYLKPIADYVARHMKDVGITDVDLVMAKNNEQLISYLKQGKIDWFSETPFSAIIFEEKAGAEVLLRRWKRGVPEYHTVFVTRKEHDIKSIKDLMGKTVAFEDPGSTTAFFVPYYVIRKEGLELVQLKSVKEKPTGNMTGYVFAGQEINMSTWLYKGIVDVLAYSNLDWVKKDHTPAAFKKEFVIFHRSKTYPRALEMVRKDLDSKIKARLKSILLNAHNDPEAKEALRAYQRTTKFDELDDKARKGLDEVRRIRRLIQREL